MVSGKDRNILLVENGAIPSCKSMPQTVIGQKQDTDIDVSSITSSDSLANEVVKDDADHVKVLETAVDEEAAISTSNGEFLNEKASDVLVKHASFPLPAKEFIKTIQLMLTLSVCFLSFSD